MGYMNDKHKINSTQLVITNNIVMKTIIVLYIVQQMTNRLRKNMQKLNAVVLETNPFFMAH